jgi:transposase, IS5 family
MLRVHLMQNWFALSDPAMEEALYEIASLRNFAGLKLSEPIADETTILNFRHMLEEYDLAEDILKQVNAHLTRKGLLLKRGSIVDATIVAAPSSTKNAEGERDPEMHQTKKGNQWHFGMKAHIGVDADSGLVHTVTTTAANEADVEQVADLLHGKEKFVCADSGYRGAQSRVDRENLKWHIAARPSDIAKMPEGRAKTRVQNKEHRKASMRGKVEHPLRVIKRQFGLMKVRFRGLHKNTAQNIAPESARGTRLTALNLLPSMATTACVNSFSSWHSTTNWRQTLRIAAAPLSRRKSAIVLNTGARRPVSTATPHCDGIRAPDGGWKPPGSSSRRSRS